MAVFDRHSNKIGYSLDGRKTPNTLLTCKVMELKKILNKKHDNDSLSMRINRYLTIDQRCFRRSLDDHLGSQIIILALSLFVSVVLVNRKNRIKESMTVKARILQIHRMIPVLIKY